jgi:1,4-dihydroxy-2-naphthoyl-CoA hydrolase
MPAPALPPLPDDIIDTINGSRGGFNTTIDLRFTKVAYDEVVAEVEVRPELHQPYGLVHGGVYSTMIETLASTGAAINAMAVGKHTVGLENSTSFLRAVRSGTLRGRALPLTRGRKTQVWTVTITDDDDRLVASGRVRMLIIDEGASIAGAQITAKSRS